MRASTIRPPHSVPSRKRMQAGHQFSSSAASHPPSSVKLRKRWKEFQGAGNWDALLDPLEPTLRSEILRYGSFLQAAYSSCDMNSSSPTYASCRFSKRTLLRLSGFPSTGYRVTRHLHATSGSSIPRWAASAAPPCFSQQSSWIGYVAVCHDDTELARIGRRDIVIALRGTVTALEWLDNLRATLTPSCFQGNYQTRPEPMVQRGFWSLFTTSGVSNPSLRDQIRDEIRRLLDHYSNSSHDISFTIVGHSLGAALAVLAADVVSGIRGSTRPMVTVISFGGPRVGNASFRKRMEDQGSKVLRIVNTRDIITKVPGFVDDQKNGGSIPSWLLSKTGWVYADIGQELRVSGLEAASVAACHDLSHYLQLIKQLSGKCPILSQRERRPRGLRFSATFASNAL